MHLYHRGIRRRLAPMLKSRQKSELAWSLLFSLPSTPLIRYGEELGMGDDLSLKERLSVRTPMQWSDARFAGFTSGDSSVCPVIDSGEYSYRKINVAAELKDKQSLLHWLMQMIRLRKSLPEIAYGKCEIMESSKTILMMRYTWSEKKLLVIHNFSEEQVIIKWKEKGSLKSLAGTGWPLVYQEGKTVLQLPGCGYQWYRIEE
jgi:maltose alpha-D-glucosyltransferase/alpha-amylase